jgi:hypothetical protein
MHADKNRISFNFVIPVQTGIQAGFNLVLVTSALSTYLAWIPAYAGMTGQKIEYCFKHVKF